MRDDMHNTHTHTHQKKHFNSILQSLNEGILIVKYFNCLGHFTTFMAFLLCIPN